MNIFEIFKVIILGIIQGITEWLPISSTGHMLLFNSFFPLDTNLYSGGQEFVDLFLIVIQFASILAVIFLFFKKLNPFSKSKNLKEKRATFSLWGKVIIGSIPVMIMGFAFKNAIHKYLYNGFVVAFMLIMYGLLFIVVECFKSNSSGADISKLGQITTQTAFLIGIFQALALIPGTSRSGATILGALLIGCSRSVGAEFSFFLAIPAMAGASVLEIVSYFKKHGLGFSVNEWIALGIGFIISFVVSIFAISTFMKFIKTHNFRPFAWYRIVLGIIIVGAFVTGFLNMGVHV